MCGRYASTLAPELYRTFYGYGETPNFPPRYNIAPTQPVAVVVDERGERHFRLMRWGFVPSWVRDLKAFPLIFNARAESLVEKATYRGAVRHRRCVFLADGFYEWRREGRTKTPFLVRLASRAPLPLAGLWETCHGPDGGEVDTAAIVTTDANGTLAALHDRMPAILAPEAVADWLGVEQVGAEEAVRLLRPCPDDWLEVVPVSPRVNRVAEDGPELQQPVGAPEPSPAPASPDPARDPVSSEEAQGRLF